MTEFGVFSDEGLVLGDLYSAEEALAWAQNPKNGCLDDDGSLAVRVAAVCPDHREHEAANCELCLTEENS